MCGHSRMQRSPTYGVCTCGCCTCGCGGFRRRYLSRAEEMEMLKDYLESLKKEIAGVEERIKELEA